MRIRRDIGFAGHAANVVQPGDPFVEHDCCKPALDERVNPAYGNTQGQDNDQRDELRRALEKTADQPLRQHEQGNDHQ